MVDVDLKEPLGGSIEPSFLPERPKWEPGGARLSSGPPAPPAPDDGPVPSYVTPISAASGPDGEENSRHASFGEHSACQGTRWMRESRLPWTVWDEVRQASQARGD